MIVITRRVGEAIVIETASGEHIELTILDTQENRVRISAPKMKNIRVLREEELEPQRYAV